MHLFPLHCENLSLSHQSYQKVVSFYPFRLGWFCLHPTECSRTGFGPVPAPVSGDECRDPWLLQMLKIRAVWGFSPKQGICTTAIPLKFREHCGKYLRTRSYSWKALHSLSTVTAIKNSQQLWLPALSWPKLALLPISHSWKRIYRTLPLLPRFLAIDKFGSWERGNLVFTCVPTAELTRLQQDSPIQQTLIKLSGFQNITNRNECKRDL